MAVPGHPIVPGHRSVPRHPRHPAVSDTRHLPFITHNSHDWDYSGDCSLGVSGGRGGHLTVLTLPEFPGSAALRTTGIPTGDGCWTSYGAHENLGGLMTARPGHVGPERGAAQPVPPGGAPRGIGSRSGLADSGRAEREGCSSPGRPTADARTRTADAPARPTAAESGGGAALCISGSAYGSPPGSPMRARAPASDAMPPRTGPTATGGGGGGPCRGRLGPAIEVQRRFRA